MKELGLYPVGQEPIPISEKLHIIKKTGFDYIAASSIAQLEDVSPEGFVRSAEKEGLPIDNVHLTGKKTSLIWYEGEEGDEIVERYKREMDIAVSRDVPLGVIHVTWGTKMPPFNRLGMERLGKIIEHADKIGFTIGFENSVSLEHYEAVFDEYHSPAVKFTFDTGHWNEFCVNEDIYDRYNHLMRITHIEDNDGIRDLHLIPFDGCTDFQKIAHSMKCMQRLTFETGGTKVRPLEMSESEIRESMKRVKILDDPSLCRVFDGGVVFYENLNYVEYIERLYGSALKIRDMVENSRDSTGKK